MSLAGGACEACEVLSGASDDGYFKNQTGLFVRSSTSWDLAPMLSAFLLSKQLILCPNFY